MAKNTSKISKKSNKGLDPLKITVIAIGVLFITLIAVAIIFDDSLSYSDAEHISAWSEIDTMDGTTYVYAYTETCPICQDIKQEMLVLNRDYPNTTLYANVPRVDGNIPTEISGVPALLIVEDGIIVDRVVGAQVVDALRSLLE